MSRAIDSENLYKFLTDQCVKETGAFAKGVNKGLNIARSALRNEQIAPTLTPQNEPLPVLVNDEPHREYIDYMCPRCKDIISQCRRGQRMEMVYQCKYHDNCGQRVDWTNPQPYRRPPERQEDTPLNAPNVMAWAGLTQPGERGTPFVGAPSSAPSAWGRGESPRTRSSTVPSAQT